MKLLALTSACLLALNALTANAQTTSNAAGISTANLDRSVTACQDFYSFANGNWLKTNPVPTVYSSWGTFNELEDRNNERLKLIATSAAARTDAPAGSADALVGDFYASFLDTVKIEKAGIEPIEPMLERISKIKKDADVIALVTDWHKQGTGVLFGLSVRQDLKDPSRVIAYAGQGGLGLPTRDYYLKDDAESLKMKSAYSAHIVRMLVLGGDSKATAEKSAKAIVALETKFAEAALPREEMRDPNKSYNVITVAQADKQLKRFSFRSYFDALDLAEVGDFSFSHPKFFKAMDQALANESMQTWRAYLKWNLLRATAPMLTEALLNENFDFYSRTLRGQQALKPRDVRAIEQINTMMGDPLGQLFVAQYFPPEAKARMMVLISNLKTALRERLDALPWMGDDTRRQALEKWSTFTPKIGYPDKWRDFSSLRFDRADYFGNVMQLAQFDQAFDLNKIGKPVDKSEWGMPPQQVNAYYNAVWNEIVFPAGILQPPFFDLKADDALNYGAIGAVIGHELMHGFDDAGSRFDAQGRLKMWWTANDRKEFDLRADRLVAQAAEYSPLPQLPLNGRISLGENIADLGGVRVAYAALQSALKDSPSKDIDGFTPSQRFFLSWAQVWRRNYTEAALRVQVNVGPHAPGKFRTNGPLSNLPEFAQAFDCKAGDPMVREGDRQVVIW